VSPTHTARLHLDCQLDCQGHRGDSALKSKFAPSNIRSWRPSPSPSFLVASAVRMAEAEHTIVELPRPSSAQRRGPGRLVRVSSAASLRDDTQSACTLEGALRRLGLDAVQPPGKAALLLGRSGAPGSAPLRQPHSRQMSCTSVLASPSASSSGGSDPSGWDAISCDSPRPPPGARHRRAESCPVEVSALPEDALRPPLWSRRGRLRAPTSIDVVAAAPQDLGEVQPHER